ncbi:MAG: vWA domain-containing protein [Myxococcota bacterium]
MRIRYSLLLLLITACDCGDDGTPGGGDASVLIDGSNEDFALPDGGDNDDGICNNGLDDDGDGQVDEGCRCDPGQRQACYSGAPAEAGEGICLFGEQVCESDFEFSQWGACVGDGSPDVEVCDGVDNNCNGEVDEGCECTPGETRECYDGPEETAGVGICTSGEERCVVAGEGAVWDACDGAVTPEVEDCDGGDEDCDGRVDEGCECVVGEMRDCYGGPDGTLGVGECMMGFQRCEDSGWSECLESTVPAAEACTGGDDEDCDGLTDCEDPDCACCEPFRTSALVVPAEAELFFVVDRSGSMDFLAEGVDRTRWQELNSALASVLPMVADTPLGLLTFPELNGTVERNWCGVASSPDIPIAVGTEAAIMGRLVAADPRAGDTPTPQAFDLVGDYLGARTTSRETFVILATDGLPEPNCGSTVAATVAALNTLRVEGVSTFVIGIVGPDRDGSTAGIPALRSALNMFADAGGRPRTGALRYYEAVDGTALTSAFRAILGEATECRFELDAAPPVGATVFQDGVVVPAAGYTLTGRSLEFAGTYCERIRAGLVTLVEARLECAD